jgi:hypothetical protein
VEALICGIIKGTPSSYLKADELSITIAHAFIAICANSFEISQPAEKSAKSSQLKKSSFTSFIIISQNCVFILFHAEFFEAQSRSSKTGIFKSKRQLIISSQTAQVAHTIQILYIFKRY